jgi:hypothetical protein
VEAAAGHEQGSSWPTGKGRRSTAWARGLTLASAALIVIGGYVHFCLYRHGYRLIPRIGIGFLLQFTSSALIAGALVVAKGSLQAGRHRVALAQLARLAGIALAIGTLVALAIAHTSDGLFGFREVGLRPAPQTVITAMVEYWAAVLLAVALVWGPVSERRARGRATQPRPSATHLRDAA